MRILHILRRFKVVHSISQVAVTTECEMHKLGLSVPETAKAIGLGLTKTWALVRDGRLPVRRIGRRTIVLVTDAEAFLRGVTPTRNGREA